MGVLMFDGCVLVGVRVPTGHRGLVGVAVVPVLMLMQVGVLEGQVAVAVAVVLREEQEQACDQDAAGGDVLPEHGLV